MNEPERSKIVPNTFQTPNALVDEYLRYLTGNETKCYLVINRKTLGWLKRQDNIALIQIIGLTGLAEATVREVLISLCNFRLVLKTAGNDPRKNWGDEYALQMDDKTIDLAGLKARAEASKEKAQAKIAKARAARHPVLLDNTTLVEQDHPGLVGQDAQKPLSKAINVVDGETPGVNLFREFEARIGPITPFIADALPDLEKEHSAPWVLEAMKLAEAGGKRSYNYIDGILKRWKVEGYGTDFPALKKKGNGNHAQNNSASPTIPACPDPETLAAARRVLEKRRAQQAPINA